MRHIFTNDPILLNNRHHGRRQSIADHVLSRRATSLLVQLWHGEVIDELHPQPELLERLDGVPVPQVLRLLLRHQDKVVLQQPVSLLGVVLGCCCLVDLVEVHDEALLDAEHGVRRLVGVATQVEGAGLG